MCFNSFRKKTFLFEYSVSCDLSAAPAPRGPHRSRPAQTDSDRHRTSPNLLEPAPVLSLTVGSGRCRVKHRHRLLETRYEPTQTGPRLVPVQASKDRCGLLDAVRCRLVSVSWRDRKIRCKTVFNFIQ